MHLEESSVAILSRETQRKYVRTEGDYVSRGVRLCGGHERLVVGTYGRLTCKLRLRRDKAHQQQYPAGTGVLVGPRMP